MKRLSNGGEFWREWNRKLCEGGWEGRKGELARGGIIDERNDVKGLAIIK